METIATKEGQQAPKKKNPCPIILRAEELKQLDDIKLATNARSRPEVIRALINLYNQAQKKG